MIKKLLFGSLLAWSGFAPVAAQKKPLDHTVYDDWKRVTETVITPKGEIIAYEIVPQEGDGKLVLELPKQKQKQFVLERGYHATLLPDGMYAVCLIKPYFKDVRQAKIDKKKKDQMPKDSLAIISLKDGVIRKFPQVISYQVGDEAGQTVAFLSADTTYVAKDLRKKKGLGNSLLIYDFKQGVVDTLAQVKSYQLNEQGNRLSLLKQVNPKKLLPSYYNIDTRKLTAISSDSLPFYSLPKFNEQGDAILFLASQDSSKTGSKRASLHRFDDGDTQATQLLPASYTLPNGWAMNEYSAPTFSEDGKQVFVGVAPVRAPKDTTKYDFETAQLDLWHWSEPDIQPMQLVNRAADLKRTYLAHLQGSQVTLLADSKYDRISRVQEGNAPFVLSVDKTKSQVSFQWDVQNEAEVALVDIATGKRKLIVKGQVSYVTASPQGKYVLWYDLYARQWKSYAVASGKISDLTAHLDIRFWDERHDTPDLPSPYGVAGFTADDEHVWLYDQYDIWQMPLNGEAPVNLTRAAGREQRRTYRYVSPERMQARRQVVASFDKTKGITLGKKALLTVFDHTSKKHGFATFTTGKVAVPQLQNLEGYTYGAPKWATQAGTYLYTKSNFETTPDLYVTQSIGKKERKLTDINPQMKDYLWGTAESYKWTAYDGTAMEGILYKPANFDPKKKYPTMIYFYERKSDDLYAHYMPVPSRSIINLSFYASRGYVVFVPDIVYHTGTPGEDAYNCIVSGAESLTKQPWIDAENMAIQGQSWGGYQVAYLITRTNMFKAAGSGAPVSNMTSAYGGIRWGTGMSRQFQYEHTQSRLGQTLWEAPEVYIANSPLFKADRVQTPVLIMHNDKDGAVPWYQGIEFFMALRRLSKPAWLLQYNNEEHNLVERRNTKDLTIRLQQFFDHYLQGAPAPAWIKSGIPATRKGEYFGFELE